MRKIRYAILSTGLATFYLMLISCCTTRNNFPRFIYQALDTTTALHPVVTDMNGDGINDLLIVTEYVDEKGDDASNMKYISIYTGPGLKRHDILYINFRADDIEAVDIDGDGDKDIVGRGSPAVDESLSVTFWLENPMPDEDCITGSWKLHKLGTSDYVKDIETGYISRDAFPDIFARTEDSLYLYIQSDAGQWQSRSFIVHPHEGMKCADLDGDGDTDAVLNGYWLETPADPLHDPWKEHVLDSMWFNQSTGDWSDNNSRVNIADLNHDGRPDILLSNSEKPGYPVVWYENPAQPDNDEWTAHVIGQIDYCHTLLPVDMDQDGNIDVVTGELIHSEDPHPETAHPITIFYNKGNSLDWEPVVIDTLGIYAAETGDIDNDGDEDIIGPHNYERGPLRLFVNQLK